MFSITDMEDKFLRPITAQMIFLLAALLLGYEVLSGAFSYYRIHLELKQSTQSQSKPTMSKKSEAIQKTLGAQIFGDYTPKNLVDLDMKPSGLNLTLVGVVFSPQPQESQAIIKLPNGNARTFSLGDQVSGGAKIKQITPDGVVLERDGELESLSLPKNALTFEPLPKPLKEDTE
ncbi:MAG: general secretion pathway protein GspC [Gammaproteobacteria bacterium]|nr:general secretion pathway protein GspC [Gammaproteobacteria bacterium]